MNKIIPVFFSILALSGCAAAIPQPVDPFQARAAELIDGYNTRHGTHVPVPRVMIDAPAVVVWQGETVCQRQPAGGWADCVIFIAPHRAFHEAAYALENTVPHEVAHVICLMTVPGCGSDDHGPAWQAIALELGVDPADSYFHAD